MRLVIKKGDMHTHCGHRERMVSHGMAAILLEKLSLVLEGGETVTYDRLWVITCDCCVGLHKVDTSYCSKQDLTEDAKKEGFLALFNSCVGDPVPWTGDDVVVSEEN